MTPLEIDKAMIDIVKEKYDECKNRLDGISKENKIERKAVQIELGMYALCGNAGLLYHAKNTREEILNIRMRFIKRILINDPKWKAIFLDLQDAEKLRFIAALQAELFMRDQMYDNYCSELAKAETAGDTKAVFELRIKVGAVKKIFEDWETWRKKNNVYPFIFEEAAE